jgi:hypothetical protein
VPHHLLANLHRQIIFPIVNHELEPDEIGQDGAGAGFGVDGCTGFEGGGEGWEGGKEWACKVSSVGSEGEEEWREG